MNVEEYISSGILESFVLGELPPDKEKEVMEYARQFPVIKQEIENIEIAMEQIALKTAITPDGDIKGKILDAIDGADEEENEKVISIKKAGTGFLKYAAAASLILALVTSYLAYNYYNNWKSTESELTNLIAQNQRVADDYNQVNQQLERLEKNIEIINDLSFERITMSGTENAPEALAFIYWNRLTEEVYLDVQQLRSLSESQQYQLWAIIDGKPVDAGVFGTDNVAMLKMKGVSGASAFAVTIEPKGGSKSPTLSTMQVLGQV